MNLQALATRLSRNLGIDVAALGRPPLVVVVANLDSQPGPYYIPTNSDGPPFFTQQFPLDVARAINDGTAEVVVPAGVPVDAVWTDYRTPGAGGASRLLFGQSYGEQITGTGSGAFMTNLVAPTNGIRRHHFREPFRGGITLINAIAPAGEFVRISVVYSRTASSKSK